MSTAKLPGWEAQEKPSEELCEKLRQFVIEVVFSRWSETGESTPMSPKKTGEFYIAQGVQKKIRDARVKGEWSDDWGFVSKRTIDRRVNEAAAPELYEDGISKIVAVTAGLYRPNPELFKTTIVQLKGFTSWPLIMKELLDIPEVVDKMNSAASGDEALRIFREEAEKRGFAVVNAK